MGYNEAKARYGNRSPAFRVFDFSRRAERMMEFAEANEERKEYVHQKKKHPVVIAGTGGFGVTRKNKHK